MADEELAPEGGAPELAPEIEQQDETPEPIVNLAREIGWVPKDEYRGDPDKWKPADQFIKDGRDIQQTTSRELRSLREQMERVAGVTETIVNDRVSAARLQWEAEIAEATEEGDTKRVLDLVGKEPQKTQRAGGDSTVQSWVAKNEWFNKDPLAQVRAKELSNKLGHLPVPEQLAQVERQIRKEFPEHFPAPAKMPPATQTASSRAAAPGNRVKGFADMPQASQQVAIEFEKLNNVKRDDFAKQYWANEAKKRVGA